MGKIKIYEIAKKLDLTSKEVLEMAKKLNIEVKSHMSSVDENDANKIESGLKNNSKQDKKVNQAKTTTAPKKEERAPVIITK